MMKMKARLTAVAAGAMALFAVGASAPASAQEDFDVNKVFWCDAGKNTGEQTEAECTASREAILSNCTVCHAFTPIVKAQKDKKGWAAFMQTHRERSPDIAADVYEGMTKFLQAHYNPQNPVPKLPPELDSLGVPPA